ncbi:hypothetical protein [Paucidesulfovibrio longus]|uniref:hypothetical protein n=1 Tax=Paucidesulfovibrio longus TaxID=889 RepID=UPI0003B4087E|nr:hypothetical protein [Paucidesulfovibrio longus]
MSTALDLLEQAMEAAREELRLLKDGDEEGALELARDRARLVRESWILRDPSVAAEMSKALERLRQLHEGVVGEARRQREKIRDELREVHGKRKVYAAYGAHRPQKVGAAMSRFVDRKS